MARNLSGFRCLLLTWRRSQSGRGLYGGGGGRGGHLEPAPSPFFRASSATYLSGPRMRPGGRRSLPTPAPPGSRSLGGSPLPLPILATPGPRSASLPLPAAPAPVGRSGSRLFPEYHLSLQLGPQMRKTALPASGFPRSVRKFSVGTLSANFLSKYLASPCTSLQPFPDPVGQGLAGVHAG